MFADPDKDPVDTQLLRLIIKEIRLLRNAIWWLVNVVLLGIGLMGAGLGVNLWDLL